MGRPVRHRGARAAGDRSRRGAESGGGEAELTPRILVTGGSGFVGREAVAALRGGELHLVSRAGDAPAGCTGHALDLTRDDPAPLLADLRPTNLLHLAWRVPPGAFWSAPENLDWVAASLGLARAFAEAGGRRATFAGTCAEYDWTGDCLDEYESPLRPHTLYGEAKASLFRLLTAAAPELGLSLAWGRIFFPYGPLEKPGRLLSSIVDGIAQNQSVPCTAGTQMRDFLHVADCGRAFAELLLSGVEGPVNLASGELHSVREFIETAAEATGGAQLVGIGERPMQPGEPAVMRANVARLRDEVGFRPAFGFHHGIAAAVRERLERVAA